MNRFNSAFFSRSRNTTLLFAVLFGVLAVACDGFYSDSLPTPDIAQPTPANIQVGDPEVVLEAAAREAIAAKLGISPDAPRKILFEGETWTERNSGCYPVPESIINTGEYLIPGYRLLMQHDGVFYEYNADQGAGTGALCDSTFQLVPAEPAHDTVVVNDSAEPDFDTVHILRSEEDVTAFNSLHTDTATIAVDEIEWEEEVLVGGWVKSSPNPEAVRAYLSEQGTSILIEVTVSDDLADEATDTPSQTWSLVDITEPDSTYEFIVVEP
jgi:hypothetical protein